MIAENLMYEVLRIDTPESVFEAIDLILNETREGREHPPKSVEMSFYGTLWDTIFYWMFESDGPQKMLAVCYGINELMEKEESSPYVNADKEKWMRVRFMARLMATKDLLETYMVKTTMEPQVRLKLMAIGPEQEKIRRVLLAIYDYKYRHVITKQGYKAILNALSIDDRNGVLKFLRENHLLDVRYHPKSVVISRKGINYAEEIKKALGLT